MEWILVGMLGVVGIVLVAQTIQESVRSWEIVPGHASGRPVFDEEPDWRHVAVPHREAAEERELEAA